MVINFKKRSRLVVLGIAAAVVIMIICFVMISSRGSGYARRASSNALRTVTVIVDAGHGGMDGGATAADGTVEKDINLSIALKLHYGGPSYSGAQVFYSKNNPESEKLAKAIQQDIRSLIQPQNQRAVKRTGTEIYLLYHAQSPAVMVECGFLSNAAETLKLKDDNYQNAMAFSVMCGITDYLKQDEKLTEVT